jgi:hypothetical protein
VKLLEPDARNSQMSESRRARVGLRRAPSRRRANARAESRSKQRPRTVNLNSMAVLAERALLSHGYTFLSHTLGSLAPRTWME